MPLEPQQQVDFHMALLTGRERQLMAEGKTKEQAEEQALQEVLREIRNS